MPAILLIDSFNEYRLSPADLFVAEDGEISEAKGLHSYKGTDDIRQAVLNIGFDLNTGQFKAARRRATSSSNAQFKALIERVAAGLKNSTDSFLSGAWSRTRWERWVKHLLKTAYHEAFDLGIKSSGAGALRAGRADIDTRWVESAYRHEMRHFNKFLREIVASAEPEVLRKEIDPKTGKPTVDPRTGRPTGKLIRVAPPKVSVRGDDMIHARMQAYADTVKHVYYAGRVMGTPDGMVIDWISPLDRRTCRGCRFLSDNSPYTKNSLPSTPRAGDTRCLNNCRCRLVVREIPRAKYIETQRAQHSRRWYADRLQRLLVGKPF
jgi:hypothetical protein